MNDFTAKQKVVISVMVAALIAASFAAGRFSVPVTVETKLDAQERAVVREKTSEKKTQAPSRTTVVERGVGQERVVVRTIERGQVVTEKASEEQARVSTQISEQRTETRDGARLLLGPTVGVRLGDLTPVYGGQVLWRLAGPFWLGASADSSGAVRAQFAISF